MKKTYLLSAIFLFLIKIASAQIIPSFQFGAKAGMNLSRFSHTATFASDNRAGYLGGVWARVGGLGFNFQPELYITGKTVNINSGNGTAQATLTSLDLPLLLGTKMELLVSVAGFMPGRYFQLR